MNKKTLKVLLFLKEEPFWRKKWVKNYFPLLKSIQVDYQLDFEEEIVLNQFDNSSWYIFDVVTKMQSIKETRNKVTKNADNHHQIKARDYFFFSNYGFLDLKNNQRFYKLLSIRLPEKKMKDLFDY